jgi:hypothetical protein
MINELRTYTIRPGKVPELIKYSSEISRPARGDKHGILEGYWTTEFGQLNQAVHLWTFDSLNDRDRLMAELGKNQAFQQDYIPKSRPLMMAQENKFLTPILPIKRPQGGKHLYELRWYKTEVGKAPEWLGHFKDIMPTREKYSKNVAVWQSHAGALNEVVHLWAYTDLNHRAQVRGDVMKDPAWQGFLGKSAGLLLEMRSIILVPAPHSPMQ